MANQVAYNMQKYERRVFFNLQYVCMYVCIISLMYITGLSKILVFGLVHKKRVKRLNYN